MLNNFPPSRFHAPLTVASLLCLLAAHATAPLNHAQQPPAGAPTTSLQPVPKGPSIRITFLPPPMDGTVSLAVFDRSGKRVRALHTEAAQTDLTVSLNGLSTTWDGKDDAGETVSPGKYRVRGLAVGDLDLTGEAFHGNDWVETEDGPRPSSFSGLKLSASTLELTATDNAGQLWRITESIFSNEDTPRFEKISAAPQDTNTLGPVTCPGKDGTTWSIEKALGETVVVQLDAKSEVLRRLPVGAGQPVPVAIAASLTEDVVVLLEQDGERWRVRGLRKKDAPENTPPPPVRPSRATSAKPATPATPVAAAPVWETFFEKNRWPCNTFSEAAPRVGRPKPFVAEPQISVKSQFNPLLGGASTDIALSVGFDESGSYLKTTDGIVLRRLTETAKLRWAVLGHDARQPALVLLQSDGTVVEEYRIHSANMLMTFDAGEYQWTGK